MKSGILEYKGKEYSFELNDKQLTIVSNSCENTNSGLESLYNFVSGKNDIEDNSIKIIHGKCFPKWNQIIFFCQAGFGNIIGTKIICIDMIVEYKKGVSPINGMHIQAEELDYIYDPIKAINNNEFSFEGDSILGLKKFEHSDSIEKSFVFEKNKIEYMIGINRTFGNDKCTPLKLNTYLRYSFKNTNDYEFIYDLFYKTKLFLALLCFRRNINFKSIKIFTKNDEDKNYETGKVTIFEKYLSGIETDIKDLKSRFIPYDIIENHSENIIQEICDENIYLEHIPNDSLEKRRITPASFIMYSSAFEWEFNKNFKEGVPHSNRKEKAKELIVKKIEYIEKDEDVKSVEKDIIKMIIFDLKKDTLYLRLKHATNQLENIVGDIFKRIYKLNKIEYDLDKMCIELEKQRNALAHGNLEKEFNEHAILGIICLERLVYVIQLKRLGFNDIEIKESINKLFGSNLMFNRKDN